MRTDLCTHNNLTLAAACRGPQIQVLALYIATPGQWRGHHLAPWQAAFIANHLHSLHIALAERGIPLWIERADDFVASAERLAHFCQQYRVNHLFYSYQYEFNGRQHDAAIENTLYDIIYQDFDDSALSPPDSVITGNDKMYKAFTPFRDAFTRRLRDELPACVAVPKPHQASTCQAPPLPGFNYPQMPFGRLLSTADEKTALAQLHAFYQQPAARYEGQRDFPAVEGTNRLSPCLAIGVLPSRQCLHRLLMEHPTALDGGADVA